MSNDCDNRLFVVIIIFILIIAGLTSYINRRRITPKTPPVVTCICQENFQRALVSLFTNIQGTSINNVIVNFKGTGVSGKYTISRDPIDNNYDGSYLIINNIRQNTIDINGICIEDEAANISFDLADLNRRLVPTNQASQYPCSPQENTEIQNTVQAFNRLEDAGRYSIIYNNTPVPIPTTGILSFTYENQTSVISTFPGVTLLYKAAPRFGINVLTKNCNVNRLQTNF